MLRPFLYITIILLLSNRTQNQITQGSTTTNNPYTTAYPTSYYPTPTPQVSSTQPPTSGSTQPPASGSTLPPTSGSTQPPTSNSTQPPASGSTQPPTSGSTQPPTSGSTQPPTSGSTQPPTSNSTQPHASGSTQPPTSRSTQPPTSNSTQPPTSGSTQPPTSGSTQPPTSNSTQPPASGLTQPPTSGSTQPPTSGSTQPPTSSSTQPPTSNSTQPPASGSTQPPTSGSTQPPTSGSTQPPTSSSTQPPTSNSRQPPTSGSTQPPTSGSTQPPASNSTQPPASGSTQPPTSGSTQPPTSGSIQPPTLGSTQSPTSSSTQPPTSSSTQPPTSSSTQPPTSGSTQPRTSGSTQSPTSGSIQPPTLGSTQSPTSGSSAPTSDSTQATTTQDSSTQSPTSDPQVNSTQSPTSTSQMNSTKIPTRASTHSSTSVRQVNSTQHPTHSPTSPEIYPTANSSLSVAMRLKFLRKNNNFDIQYLNSSSSAYRSLEAEVNTELLNSLRPNVTDVTLLYVRPGSVDVTTILTIQSKSVVPFVEEKLSSHSKLGSIGSMSWDDVSWTLAVGACQLPVVEIVNLADPQGAHSEIYRSRDLIIQTSVGKTRCNSSNALQFQWYLNQYTVDNSGQTNMQKRTLVDSNHDELNVVKRTLFYGQYFVELNVAYSELPALVSSAVGFFSIVKSPLIALIQGGSLVTRGVGSPITLNGSLSRDPDVEPGDHTEIQFTWLCKSQREDFPMQPLDQIPVVTVSSGPGSGGCFGTGVGKLGTNSIVAVIDTSKMDVGESYDIRLLVTKDDRMSHFDQHIKIVNGDPPEVTIRCLINCEDIASLSLRISLETSCIGPACSNANYKWQLLIVNDDGSVASEVGLTREMTESNLNLTGIVIRENKLAKEKKYRLQVTVTPRSGPVGQAAYRFETNAPPHSGHCTVSPTDGEALKTEFTFSCNGWKDNDKPLTYQFHYKTEEGLYTVVSYGSQDHVTTVLPPGKNNDEILFEVRISDSFAAATTERLIVKVRPSSQTEDITKLAVGNSSRFSQLVQLGDLKAAVQFANVVLETVDQPDDNTSTEDKITIKDSIVKELSTADVRNLQSLTQVTSAIARATQEPNEVTVGSQRLALQTLDKMTSLLKTKTADDYVTNVLLVEQGGENLVLSLGNLLNAAAEKASVLGTIKESNNTRRESEETSRSGEKLLDDVGAVLLSRMVVDQDPRKIKTRSMEMRLSRQSPSSLGTNSDLSNNAAGFKVSHDAITDDKAKNAKYIDSVMTVSSFNRYTWDESALLVQSDIVGLIFKDHEGQELLVRNSKIEVELRIPRHDKPIEDDAFFVKPSSEGKMQYHDIKVEYAVGNTLRFKIKPAEPVSFRVFVRYGQRPTVTTHDLKRKVPDEACGLQSQNTPGGCSDEAYTVFVPDDVITRSGMYYIGILYDKDDEKSKRKKRSCFGGRRQKRSCVEPKDPPKPENITIKPSYDPTTDVNYSMSIVKDSCLFWDIHLQEWSSQGCRVGPESNSLSLQCLCTHLTSFGGGLLVMPNKIDFDVVLKELLRLDETKNIAVLCTIVVAVLVYFIVVVFARRADRQDTAKSGPVFQLNLSQGTVYQYELTVSTGVWKGSGTEANVVMVIHGSEAQSQPIILSKNMMKQRRILARGNEDHFVVNLPMTLGTLQYLHVWHDNTGKKPAWFLGHVIIKDRLTGEKWTFVSNTWFALGKGDGKINRILTPISSEEMKTFAYSFNSRSSKSFSDGHLWLSVVTKPPKSEFTRVQRATCCLCLLLSAMLANAMFYRADKAADPTIQIGPLKFSWRQIVVGIESALIVTPVNLLIIALFKNSAKRVPKRKVGTEKPENKTTSLNNRKYSSLRDSESPVDMRNHSGGAVVPLQETSLRTRLLNWLRTNRVDGFKFPYFFIYIAWFLCFAVVSVSSTLTFFYSLQWGKDIANQWLSSMLISFTEDLFVLQPLKICLVMLLTALFIRSDATNKEPSSTSRVEPQSLATAEEADNFASDIKVEMPKEDELVYMREYSVKEAKMFSFGRELVVYLLFLALLTIVCYGNRSQHGYLMTKNLKDTFKNFSRSSDPRLFWKWLEGQFVSGIYAGDWYNGQRVADEEYIGNKMSILLGMPRLRQLRVQKDSCEVPEKAQTLIKHCNDFYSLSHEDKTPLNLPGWKPLTGNVHWANISDLCPVPWRYASPADLGFVPAWGFFSVYDGGGYVADLGYSNNTAGTIISGLRSNNWIDRQTRAVLTEFTIYNPNTGYLSISTYYYEMLPTGYGNTFPRIETLLLTSTETGFYQFYLICQLLFIVMVFFFVVRETYTVYKNKSAYFRNLWNWIEILQILFSFLVVIFYVIKSKQILNSVTKLTANPFITVSFQKAVAWNDSENGILAVTVFVATVKLLRMIRFNPHVSILLSSFRVSRELLLSYSVIIIVIFLSYAQLGRLVFGCQLYRYSSFQHSLFSELQMSLGGKMNLYELMRVNRILGPLFGFSFMMLMSFIFVNFFVAILNDSYEDVRSNTDKLSKEFEMADFILTRLLEFLGMKRPDEMKSKRGSKREKMAATATNVAEVESQQGPRTEEFNHRKVGLRSVAALAVNTSRLRRRRKMQLHPLNEQSRKTVRKRSEAIELKPAELDHPGSSSNKGCHGSKAPEFGATNSLVFSVSKEHELETLISLVKRQANDAVREDFELLSLIVLLMRQKNDETVTWQITPENVEVELCPSISAPYVSSDSDYDDEWDSVPEYTDYNLLELLKNRPSLRQTPHHLTGREQIRLSIEMMKTNRQQPRRQARRKRTQGPGLFKYYPFVS